MAAIINATKGYLELIADRTISSFGFCGLSEKVSSFFSYSMKVLQMFRMCEFCKHLINPQLYHIENSPRGQV